MEKNLMKIGIRVPDDLHVEVKAEAPRRRNRSGKRLNTEDAYEEALSVWLAITPNLHKRAEETGRELKDAVAEALELWLSHTTGNKPADDVKKLQTDQKNTPENPSQSARMPFNILVRGVSEARLDELLRVIESSGSTVHIGAVSTILQAIVKDLGEGTSGVKQSTTDAPQGDGGEIAEIAKGIGSVETAIGTLHEQHRDLERDAEQITDATSKTGAPLPRKKRAGRRSD